MAAAGNCWGEGDWVWGRGPLGRLYQYKGDVPHEEDEAMRGGLQQVIAGGRGLQGRLAEGAFNSQGERFQEEAMRKWLQQVTAWGKGGGGWAGEQMGDWAWEEAEERFQGYDVIRGEGRGARGQGQAH